MCLAHDLRPGPHGKLTALSQARPGWFYVGAGGTFPQPPDSLGAPDSKASWKKVGLYGVHICFDIGERIKWS